jgi:probable F420-dependent oxidoreductase
MQQRPFRFGLQAFTAHSASQWRDTVRQAEDLGFSTLFTCDHYFGPGDIAEASNHRPVELAPLSAIAVAAAWSRTLRVGCRVWCCDYHHPVVLAKEMATLDLLSDGRLEVGLGAGWIEAEYQGLGIPMDSPGTRIERLEEYVQVLRAHFTGEPVQVQGRHVQVSGFEGRPLPVQRPHPPIMIGGGSPKVLRLAGRLADVVSLNYDNSSGRLGPSAFASSRQNATRQKLDWVREGAGDRFDHIEIEIGLYAVEVTDQRREGLEAIARRFGMSLDEAENSPHVAVGTIEEICETLQQRREAFGISYLTVAERNLEAFAPVVQHLAGQ